MTSQRLAHVIVPVAVLALAGCEAAKSANPTSPSVAGPIAGVTITPPAPVAPGQGAAISAKEQPVTLTVQNASTNGQRPITYRFEVAIDADFGNKVIAREGIEPGSDGKTSFRLPDALAADRTYFWRAKAVDGANESPYSQAIAFAVVTLAEIQAPVPIEPISSATTSSRSPEFKVRNSTRSGPTGAIAYTFEIAEDQAFSQMVAVVTVAEQNTETKFTLAQQLKASTKHYWRVRGFDSNVSSPWSLTQSFVTPAAVVTPPPNTPPTTPPSTGWPTNGPAVVNYAKSRWPERLVAGVSLSQRQENMAFLRDRMIEAGICGGMDLAWNMKRGGPEKSIDYLAYQKAGVWIGVDIGFDYDNTSNPLTLTWGENPGDPYLSPAAYSPRPTCK
jgi:hypothetical protein